MKYSMYTKDMRPWLKRFPLIFPSCLVLAILASVCPARLLGTLSIDPTSVNISLSNDMFSHNAPPSQMAVGDFDGNGVDDIAFGRPENREIVVLMNSAEGSSLLSQATMVRIKFENQLSDFEFVDLNGDGKKELAIGTGPSETAYPLPPFPGQVDVVFWAADLPGSLLDLSVGVPGIRVTGNGGDQLGSPLVAGDFLGDGIPDLFMGALGLDGGYWLEGQKGLTLGTRDLAAGASLPRIVGAGAEILLEGQRGDFDGDGKDDLALACPFASAGGKTANGEIHIVYGRPSFPSVLTLGSATEGARVRGAIQGVQFYGGIYALAAGDLTGDGQDELIVGVREIPAPYLNTPVRPVFFLAGTVLTNTGVIVDLAVATTTPLTSASMGVDPAAVLVKDFDGDGKKDLMFLTMDNGISRLRLLGRLSSDAGSGPGAFAYTGPENWSFDWAGDWTSCSIGEWRGDSPLDLVAYEKTIHGPPFGSFQALFGFRLLKNPFLHIRNRFPTGPRVTLDLDVAGDPTEVQFEGDLNPSFLGRWWPYQPVFPIDLSSPLESKEVRAVFRNRVGQKSATVSDTVTMSLGESGSEVVANLISAGERVRVNCHLENPAHVEADVYSREGVLIAHVLNVEGGTGVWPVEWDGKNGAGQSVVPGMYLLILKVNGHGETHKLIVQ